MIGREFYRKHRHAFRDRGEDLLAYRVELAREIAAHKCADGRVLVAGSGTSCDGGPVYHEAWLPANVPAVLRYARNEYEWADGPHGVYVGRLSVNPYL